MGHDVVRGDLTALLGTEGNFTAAVQECLADDLVAPSLAYTGVGGLGNDFFLVRSACLGGVASYESGDSGQVGARDAEIDAASGACAD